MARYEIKNIYPPADVLKNLAELFGTTIDFLVMGDNETKAQASLKDPELINQYKKIAVLPEEEKILVLKMIQLTLETLIRNRLMLRKIINRSIHAEAFY